jgi:hypothetical protein
VKKLTAISRLAAAGIDAQLLSDDHRAVLSSLSADEVDTLLSIKQRFDYAEGDIEGHADGDPKPGNTGGFFW